MASAVSMAAAAATAAAAALGDKRCRVRDTVDTRWTLPTPPALAADALAQRAIPGVQDAPGPAVYRGEVGPQVGDGGKRPADACGGGIPARAAALLRSLCCTNAGRARRARTVPTPNHSFIETNAGFVFNPRFGVI